MNEDEKRVWLVDLKKNKYDERKFELIYSTKDGEYMYSKTRVIRTFMFGSIKATLVVSRSDLYPVNEDELKQKYSIEALQVKKNYPKFGSV